MFYSNLRFFSTCSKGLSKVKLLFNPKNPTAALQVYFENPNDFDAVYLMNRKEINFSECKRIYECVSNRPSLNTLTSMYFASRRTHQAKWIQDEYLEEINRILCAMTVSELKGISQTLWNMILNAMVLNAKFQKRAQIWYEKLESFHLIDQLSEKNRSCLLNSYCESGKLEMVRKLFYEMKEPTVIDVTNACQLLMENFYLQEVKNILLEMSIYPDAILFTTLIKTCTKIKYLEGGRLLHLILSELYDNLLSDITLKTSLINFYTKCSQHEKAIHLFNNSHQKNIVMINCYLQAIISSGKVDQAFEEFHNIVEPSTHTFVIMLNACIEFNLFEKGCEICNTIENLLRKETIAMNSVISFYAKFGMFEKSLETFQSIQNPDTPMFNTMLKILFKNERISEAFSLFERMQFKKNVSDTSFVIMLNECTERKMRQDGERIIVNLPSIIESSMELCNTILKFYCSFKCDIKARELFEEMLRLNKMDFISVIEMLSLYCETMSLERGVELHQLAVERGFNGIEVQNAILNFYGKVGEMDRMLELFDDLMRKEEIHISLITWNVVLSGCAQNGLSNQAEKIFETMISQGFEPNEDTILHMLSSFSHSMNPGKSLTLYQSLSKKYQIEPSLKLKISLVDGLVRSGLFDEAEKVIGNSREMKLWSTYLSGCRKYNDLERAEKSFEILKEIDETDSSNYILLANIYSHFDETHEKAEKLTKDMKLLNSKKIPSISTIEMNGITTTFTNNDKTHPEIKEIEEELSKLNTELIEIGYKPDLSCFSKHGNYSDEEKKNHLFHHSEKLALAYAFIHQQEGSSIRIAQNLRMCRDCHATLKFASKVRSFDIIVRDASRIHHFENGKCSCHDNW